MLSCGWWVGGENAGCIFTKNNHAYKCHASSTNICNKKKNKY